MNDTFFPDDATKGNTGETHRQAFIRWAEPIIALAILLIIPFLLWVTVIVFGVQHTVNQQSNFSKAGRQSRIEFQARQTFLLCSRDQSLVSPEKRADILKLCAGYKTYKGSVQTEQAKQEAATKTATP